MIYKFIKDKNGEWYIDLPEYSGPHKDLQMVMGADTMLDILAQGEGTIELYVSPIKFDGYSLELEYFKEESDGGWYHLISPLYNFDVWLCKVTKYVFDELPKKLYIR